MSFITVIKLIADALSILFMGNDAHVEDEKKELVQDVHSMTQLGFQLVYSTKGGVNLHFCSKSFL